MKPQQREVAGLGYSASAIFTFWDNQPLGDSVGWSRDIRLPGSSASRLLNFWDVQRSASAMFRVRDIQLLRHSASGIQWVGAVIFRFEGIQLPGYWDIQSDIQLLRYSTSGMFNLWNVQWGGPATFSFTKRKSRDPKPTPNNCTPLCHMSL